MKYKISYNEDIYPLLKDVQHAIFRIKNKATTMAYDWQQFSFSYQKRFGNWPKEKDIIGQSMRQDIYHEVKELSEGFNSMFCDVAVKEAIDHFNLYKKDILKGEQSINTYKRLGAFPVRASQLNNIQKNKKGLYTAKLSILSPKKAKDLKLNTRMPINLESGGSANAIMDRIIDGMYTLSDSKIVWNPKKKSFFLHVSYQFEKEPIFADHKCIMGIDLGVNNPATISINKPSVPSSSLFVGDAGEVQHFEKQMEDRKRQLQKSRKWSGKGSNGRGVKTKIKPVTKIRNKIANYKATKNHNWSRYIIDTAAKHGVGVIQMEDLKGIPLNNKFLKQWTYHDLQEKISYKAKELGIKVRKIPPHHTSARCHECGAIHHPKDRHIWRNQSSTLTCMNCGHTAHADKNAAKNMAIENIEQIINAEKKDWFQKFKKLETTASANL